MFSTMSNKSSRVTMSSGEGMNIPEENVAKTQPKMNFMNPRKVDSAKEDSTKEDSAKEDYAKVDYAKERTLNKLQQLFGKGEILHKAPKPILLEFLGADCDDGIFHMCKNVWKDGLGHFLTIYLDKLSKLKNNLVFSVVKNRGTFKEKRITMTPSSHPDEKVYTSYISHVLDLNSNDTLHLTMSLTKNFKAFNFIESVITLLPCNSVGRERRLSHTAKNVSVTSEEYIVDLSKSDRLNFSVNQNNEIVVLDSGKYTISIQTTGYMDSSITFEDDLSILPNCLFKKAFLYGLRNWKFTENVSDTIKDFVYDHIKTEEKEKDRQIEEDRQKQAELEKQKKIEKLKELENEDEEDKKESFWYKFDKMIDTNPDILSEFVKYGDFRKVITKNSSKKLKFIEKVCLNESISMQSKQLVLYLYLNLITEEKCNPHTSLGLIVKYRMTNLTKIFYLLFPQYTMKNISTYSNITIFDSMKALIDTSDAFYEFLRNKDRMVLTDQESDQYRAYFIDNGWSNKDRLSVDDLEGQTFSDVYKRYNEIKELSYFKLVKEDYDNYFSKCEWPLDHYQEFINYFNHKEDCWEKFLHAINICQALYMCKTNISHDFSINQTALIYVLTHKPNGTSPFDIIMWQIEAIERRHWSEYLSTRKLRSGTDLPEDVICEIKKRQAQCEMYRLTFYQQNIETLRVKIIFGFPIY